MAKSDYQEILEEARESFIEGDYSTALPLLQQVILRNNRIPEVFQMLATIYYDQGKFNKAIKTFKRALEIDPGYTDASIGLSIILNDLGRYDEGKKVFQEAQEAIEENEQQRDPYVEEKLATKHLELGEIYFNYKRYDEALEQFFKALKLSTRKPEITMKIADTYVKKGNPSRATKELKSLIQEYPQYIAARNRLAVILYNNQHVAEAVEQWENILNREPDNEEAKRYVRMAQDADITAL